MIANNFIENNKGLSCVAKLDCKYPLLEKDHYYLYEVTSVFHGVRAIIDELITFIVTTGIEELSTKFDYYENDYYRMATINDTEIIVEFNADSDGFIKLVQLTYDTPTDTIDVSDIKKYIQNRLGNNYIVKMDKNYTTNTYILEIECLNKNIEYVNPDKEYTIQITGEDDDFDIPIVLVDKKYLCVNNSSDFCAFDIEQLDN